MRPGGAGIQRRKFPGLGNLSGCVGWFDGALGATVSQWTDQSGHGNHWVQATAGNQPTINASSINGKPGITFNGRAYSGGPVISGAKTTVTVCKLNSSLGVSAYWSLLTLKNGSLFHEFAFTDIASYVNTVVILDDFAGSQTALGTGQTLDTSAHVLIHTFNGGTNTTPGNYSEQQDGTVETVAAHLTNARTTTDLGSLGARLSSGNVVSFAGNFDIDEQYIFNRVLTATEIANGYHQMKQKYALP